MKRYHVRPVRQGLVGIGMDFHEEAIDSDAGCCAGQWLHEFTLPLDLVPPPPGNCTLWVASKTTG